MAYSWVGCFRPYPEPVAVNAAQVACDLALPTHQHRKGFASHLPSASSFQQLFSNCCFLLLGKSLSVPPSGLEVWPESLSSANEGFVLQSQSLGPVGYIHEPRIQDDVFLFGERPWGIQGTEQSRDRKQGRASNPVSVCHQPTCYGTATHYSWLSE